jgi:hypothetical protein
MKFKYQDATQEQVNTFVMGSTRQAVTEAKKFYARKGLVDVVEKIDTAREYVKDQNIRLKALVASGHIPEDILALSKLQMAVVLAGMAARVDTLHRTLMFKPQQELASDVFPSIGKILTALKSYCVLSDFEDVREQVRHKLADKKFYVLYVEGAHEFTGFGVSCNIESRIATHKFNLEKVGCKIQGVAVFGATESGFSALEMERQIKSNYEILSVPIDGFRTESTELVEFSYIVEEVSNRMQQEDFDTTKIFI